ncbi:zinc ribbon domain-containing protein [Polaromonas sp.]|uniref:zinc ribbon domain-containing protein n=1 Tax=Polaromonas sp. TaxID=1869339 RepID=UPI003523D90C
MGFLDKLLQSMGGGHHGSSRSGHGSGHGSGRGDGYGYPPPPAPPYTAPSGGGPTCPSCSAANIPGARFCAQCGKSVIPGICSNCNTPLVAGAKFCPNCGKPQT